MESSTITVELAEEDRRRIDALVAALAGKCEVAQEPEVPEWRPATIEDAIRAIRGEKVEARFRDNECHPWGEDGRRLIGGSGVGIYRWVSQARSGGTASWRFCEVRNLRG